MSGLLTEIKSKNRDSASRFFIFTSFDVQFSPVYQVILNASVLFTHHHFTGQLSVSSGDPVEIDAGRQVGDIDGMGR